MRKIWFTCKAVVDAACQSTKVVILYILSFVEYRFTDLKDPNDWLFSFNPCYTFSQQQCSLVYVSNSGAVYFYFKSGHFRNNLVHS